MEFLICFLITLAMLQHARAVVFSATDNTTGTAGGDRFTNEIGLEYTLQKMNSSAEFIWAVFNETTAEDRRAVQQVSLVIESKDGVAYTVVDTSEIHVSSKYIEAYSGDVKTEFTGVLYHEMTHVWQWFGTGTTPGGLTEGIADFVRLKAGLAPSHWRKPGQGDRWDQGYDVTAFFLDYCEGLRSGFVAEINKKLWDGYDKEFFVDLLGKTVDELWSEYKAKYGN